MNLNPPVQLPSPASSPPPGADSSPPSSPDSFAPISLDSPPGPSHPFAASSRANRRPPLYEKKNLPSSQLSSAKYSLNAPRSRSDASAFRSSREDDDYLKDAQDTRRRTASSTMNHLDQEAVLWDEAITSAIDKGNGNIGGLGYVPQC